MIKTLVNLSIGIISATFSFFIVAGIYIIAEAKLESIAYEHTKVDKQILWSSEQIESIYPEHYQILTTLKYVHLALVIICFLGMIIISTTIARKIRKFYDSHQ